MIGSRTLRSLAQYLELQRSGFIDVILEKHGLYTDIYGTDSLLNLVHCLEGASESQINSLLDEITRTSGDLRSRVSPRYRYDERFDDLQRCLMLDGYMIGKDELVPLDPSIVGTPPIEDDLTRELRNSKLPEAGDVIQKLNDSADSFRAPTPNYNASLNDARVAIQTLATDIADARRQVHSGAFDRTKWGSVIAYLHNSGFITKEEERGLVGVYSFVSPGSHRSLGLSEEEYTRLGRTFIAGMCWFLVKHYESVP